MAYGVDRHLWPLDVAGDTIVWDEAGTTHSASISTPSEAWYWYSASSGVLPGNAFADQLEATLNSTGDTNFVVESQTPSGSSLTESGLRVTNNNLSQWNWLFSDSSFSLDTRILGWGSDPSDPAAANTIDSPYSVRGKWQAWSLAKQNTATDKRDAKEYLQEASHGEVEQAFILQYGDRRHTRTFEYSGVPAAHVKEKRGDDADYASFGDLPTGDINNTIFDLWEHIHDGSKALVVHDEGDAADFAEPSSGNGEGYRIDNPQQRARVDEWYQTEERRGEIYTVSFDVVITDEGYDF